MGKNKGSVGIVGRERVDPVMESVREQTRSMEMTTRIKIEITAERGRRVANKLGIDLSKWSPSQLASDLPKLSAINPDSIPSSAVSTSTGVISPSAEIKGRPLSELL